MATRKVSGVSRTAIGVARLRALEQRRKIPLFNDPHAELFVNAAGYEVVQEEDPGRDVFGLQVAIRTRFYDDHLLAAANRGCRQVVLLAAGLDTRAFRLDWPPRTRFFELDLPELLEFKEQVLAGQTPRGERQVLPVDLREDWPARLIDAGFRREDPTVWLVEGLLIYLTADEASTLLTAVGELSAPGSELTCEHRDNERNSLIVKARATPGMDRLTELWKGGLNETTVGWLGRHGWRVATHDGAALADGYGRPDPQAASIAFLTAVREGAAERTS
jgi:methyltransferase (TIGR00027 family)